MMEAACRGYLKIGSINCGEGESMVTGDRGIRPDFIFFAAASFGILKAGYQVLCTILSFLW